MKNIKVIILTDRLDAVKEIDGFESYSHAVEFARNEANWRGCPVEVQWTDGAGNTYSKLF